jgi:hypothetical protein
MQQICHAKTISHFLFFISLFSQTKIRSSSFSSKIGKAVSSCGANTLKLKKGITRIAVNVKGDFGLSNRPSNFHA